MMRTLNLNSLAFKSPTPLVLDMSSAYNPEFGAKFPSAKFGKAYLEGYYDDERVFIEMEPKIYKTLRSRYTKMKPESGTPGMLYLFCHVYGVESGLFGINNINDIKPCHLVVEYPRRNEYITLCREYGHGVSWLLN